jgi:hypothetical protein
MIYVSVRLYVTQSGKINKILYTFESVHLRIGKITLNLWAYWAQLSESYYFSLQAETGPVSEIQCFIYHFSISFINCKTPNNGQSPFMYSIMKTNKIHSITHV